MKRMRGIMGGRSITSTTWSRSSSSLAGSSSRGKGPFRGWKVGEGGKDISTSSYRYPPHLEDLVRVSQAMEFLLKGLKGGQYAAIRSTCLVSKARARDHAAAAAAESTPDHKEGSQEATAGDEQIDALVAERRVRPSLLNPVWHLVGYTIGVTTAIASPSASSKTTAVVTSLMNEQYTDNLRTMMAHASGGGNCASKEAEAALKSVFKARRDDPIRVRVAEGALLNYSALSGGMLTALGTAKKAIRTSINVTKKI